MSALLDVAVNLGPPLASALLAYLVRVVRRVDRRLEAVDSHERAIYGDETTSWPGLMQLVDDERPIPDGGESRE